MLQHVTTIALFIGKKKSSILAQHSVFVRPSPNPFQMDQRRHSDSCFRRMESYPLHSFSLGGSVSPCSPTSGVPSGAGASANRTGDKTKFEDVVHTNTMGGAIKRICEQLEGLTQLQQSVKEVQQSLSLLQGSVLFQDKTLEQVRLLLVDRGTKSWDMSQDFSSEAPAVQHVECPKPIQKRKPQMYGTSISGCHIFLILFVYYQL